VSFDLPRLELINQELHQSHESNPSHPHSCNPSHSWFLPWPPMQGHPYLRCERLGSSHDAQISGIGVNRGNSAAIGRNQTNLQKGAEGTEHAKILLSLRSLRTPVPNQIVSGKQLFTGLLYKVRDWRIFIRLLCYLRSLLFMSIWLRPPAALRPSAKSAARKSDDLGVLGDLAVLGGSTISCLFVPFRGQFRVLPELRGNSS
jgi:hypothetical protein